MDQMVSTSLCGLPLYKAAMSIGILHTVAFGGFFLYEFARAIVDELITVSPPGFLSLLNTYFVIEMFSNEAFFSFVAALNLVGGAWKGEPGLILLWLLQQGVLIFASFFTLFYYVVASYLHAPIRDCLFELFINAIQGYFFVVVFAHFKELRRGNLNEDNNQMIN